ncbi:MAG: hypothetical protein PHH09_04635 [Methanoregulaceae archaeon]|nr:hypothetical protein [Methanoregulaceae archaeon]
MNPTKKKNLYKIIWWYPGGPLHSDYYARDFARKFTDSIINCGGTATLYPPGAW